VFYGWVIVAAVHVALFVIFGVAYSFAAFFGAFEEAFRASRGDVALVFSLCGFLYFMVGAVSGTIADRFGPRRVALFGMAVLGLSLILASRASSLSMLYLSYGVGVGLGVGCVYVPAVGAVQPWFARRRGLASGIAAAGIGLGTLFVPILAGWLVPDIGWRSTLLAFGVAALVIGGLAASLLDNNPARRGLAPDGDPIDRGVTPAAPSRALTGATLREALASRVFWWLYGATLFFSVGLYIPFAHLAPYARDHGHSGEAAALLIGAIGLGSLIGRFALAGLADRWPRPLFMIGVFAGMGIMLAAWLGLTGFIGLALFAVLFGICYGAYVALAPALVMDFFGGRNVSGIIGALYTSAGFGNLLGPWLAGVAFDASGSYVVPIIAGIVCMVIAVLCSARLLHAPSLAR
jgi:MFS family permease